jgi:hypothetical protein
LRDVRPRPLLGGQPGDVAVVLHERRLAGEEAGVVEGCLLGGFGEAVGGQAAERLVEQAGAGDRGLHRFLPRDPAGPDLLGQADGVVLTECVVAEGVLAGCRLVGGHGPNRTG